MTGFCVNLLNSKFYHPCSHGKDINLKLYLINVMSYKYIPMNGNHSQPIKTVLSHLKERGILHVYRAFLVS